MHLPPQQRAAARAATAVAARREATGGVAGYVMAAGIAAGLMMLWAGICMI